MKYSDEKYNFIVSGYEPIKREYKDISYAELFEILEALKKQRYKDVEVKISLKSFFIDYNNSVEKGEEE